LAVRLFLQFLGLSLYTVFVGFCFCDGFKLHILRKLIWFGVFLVVSLYTFSLTKQFDLTIILPVPTLLAISLCAYEKGKTTRKAKG